MGVLQINYGFGLISEQDPSDDSTYSKWWFYNSIIAQFIWTFSEISKHFFCTLQIKGLIY